MLAASEGADPISSFQISKSGTTIRIHVLRTSSLDQVLEGLCSRVGANCTGISLTSQFPISPLQIAGSWDEVIAKLLEGTRLNFVTQTVPSTGISSLLVQGPYTKEEPASSRNSAVPSVADALTPEVDAAIDASVPSTPSSESYSPSPAQMPSF